MSEKKIALISPGDRTDKITVPLDTTDISYTINPQSSRGFDVVLADTPDREMLKKVVEGKLRRQTVLFRMRGDPFFGLKEWIDSRFKRWIANDVMLGQVDGCIAIAPHQADKYTRKTGVGTQIVGLPKRADEWPTVNHTDRELRIVTLTNAVYWPKIEPLLEIAEVVNDVLSITGGYWKIGSWSDGYSDKIRSTLNGYEHVQYHQGLDAKKELEQSNLMIHYSNMDVLPNAILEGMASRVPVLTNDYVAFRDSQAPILVHTNGEKLKERLLTLQAPHKRERYGHRGLEYVKENHSPEAIGQDFKAAIAFFHE